MKIRIHLSFTIHGFNKKTRRYLHQKCLSCRFLLRLLACCKLSYNFDSFWPVVVSFNFAGKVMFTMSEYMSDDEIWIVITAFCNPTIAALNAIVWEFWVKLFCSVAESKKLGRRWYYFVRQRKTKRRKRAMKTTFNILLQSCLRQRYYECCSILPWKLNCVNVD